MGKRGDSKSGKRAESPVPISARVQAVVARAQQLHGKPSQPKSVPKAPAAAVATPVRSNSKVPEPAPCTPSQAGGPVASPMSTSSTPLVSPELKRYRSTESSESLASSAAMPSLPGFDSVSSSSLPRHSASATTLSMTQYFAQLDINRGQFIPGC